MLRTGYFAAANSRIPPEAFYKSWQVDTGNRTTYTFTNVNIGPDFPGRIIAGIAFMGNGGSTALRLVTGMTIGGVAATVHDTDGIDDNGSGNSMSWGLGTAGNVPGSTATISFSLTGSPSNAALGVYVLSDVENPVPIIVKDDSRNPLRFSLPALGANTVLIGGACSFGGSRIDVSSTGGPQPTYDGGGTMESSRFSGVFSMLDASGSPQISANIVSSSYDRTGFVAIWGD